MALPTGCFKVCRPARKEPRKFTAKDVGRAACYAREAGESSADIMAEVGKCVEVGECDCERIGQKVGIALAALGILATVFLSRGKANKLAAEETTALIERLRASSSTVPVGTIQIAEEVRSMLLLGGEVDAEMNAAFQDLLDNLKGIQQDSFATPLIIEIIGGN